MPRGIELSSATSFRLHGLVYNFARFIDEKNTKNFKLLNC